MEFPDLGKHCSESHCNKLDFLPMRCDACRAVFCSDHFNYSNHACPSSHQKDVQVPICPLCGDPVPTPRDVSPDVTVGAHIDRFCKSDRKRIYTNRCSFRNCKKKELVPMNCSVCKLNFCLKHRHTTDHDCKGTAAGQRNLAATAAIQRQQQPLVRSVPNVSSAAAASRVAFVQGTMSEDEALARALALSLEEEESEEQRRNPTAGRNPANRNPTRGITVGGSNGGNGASGGAKDKCNLS